MRNWRVPVTFTISLDGQVTSWSESVEAVLGYGKAEFVGKRFELLFTPEDISADAPIRLFSSVLENGCAPLAGWRLDKDGERRFARGELAALYAGDDEIVGISVAFLPPLDEPSKGVIDVDQRLLEAYEALEIAALEWEPRSGAWQESGTTVENFGLAPGDLLGGRQAQLATILAVDLERYRGIVDGAIERREGWRAEYRVRREVDGEVAWLEENGSVMPAAHPLRYSIIAWDITPTKIAEERLRTSQRRLRQELASNRRLQEVMSRSARTDDPQTALAEVLDGASELFAAHRGTMWLLSRADGILRLVAQRWFDEANQEQNSEIVVDPTLLDRRFGHLAAADHSDGGDLPSGLANDVIEAGGYVERWVPLYGLSGNVVGLLALHWRRPWRFSDRDEHDLALLAGQAGNLVDAHLNRQRSQQLEEDLKARVSSYGAELLESEIRFRRAFEIGPMAACITTTDDDRFIEVNSGYVKLTGYDSAEVVGKTSRQLGMWSSSEDQAKLEAAFRGGGDFSELELKLRTKDGLIRDILLSGQQITYHGQPTWLKMFNDVTDQHRSQEELMAAIREVMSDSAWFGQSVVQRLAEIRGGSPHDEGEFELTARERQVLELVAAGLNDEEIAEILGISQKTVRNHVSNTYAKTGVHSRSEAIVWARERGMVARL